MSTELSNAIATITHQYNSCETITVFRSKAFPKLFSFLMSSQKTFKDDSDTYVKVELWSGWKTFSTLEDASDEVACARFSRWEIGYSKVRYENVLAYEYTAEIRGTEVIDPIDNWVSDTVVKVHFESKCHFADFVLY